MSAEAGLASPVAVDGRGTTVLVITRGTLSAGVHLREKPFAGRELMQVLEEWGGGAA
jgi:hypothetical protein